MILEPAKTYRENDIYKDKDGFFVVYDKQDDRLPKKPQDYLL